MKIILKKMKLTNFKSFEYKEINFSHDTVISGRNGVGKTSIADAYNWCLYGKNSLGKTVVGEIKRRDEKCQVVHNLDYAVELIFDIDGNEKSFKRLVNEKWTKPKGCPEKILSGHDVTYYINGLQCSTKKEYEKHVNELASEDVLRIMTEVGYFFTLKEDEQKQHLIRLAYDTNNIEEANEMAAKDVLANHQEFADFISNLNGEKADDFVKKVKKQINVLKDELQSIPQQISAKQEAMPAEEDWAMIDARIKFKKDELAKIKGNTAEGQKEIEIAKLEKEVAEAQAKCDKRKDEIRIEVINKTKPYNDKVASLKAEINNQQQQASTCEIDINSATTTLNKLNAERNKLVEEWKQLKAGTIQFNDDELVCPTCKRPFDKNELIKVRLEINMANGKALKPQIDELTNRISVLQARKTECEKKYNDAVTELDGLKNMEFDFDDACMADLPLRELNAKLSEKTQKLLNTKVKTNQPKDEKAEQLYNEMQELMAKKGTKEVIETIKAQIKELKDRQRDIANEITELENTELQAMDFIKLRDNSIADKVNKLFCMISFSFITDQLNGVDKVACNCYVQGMPYADKNNAGKVNAGLDIINAFSKHENVSLPIFIDNAESVLSYIGTESQKILLAVLDNEFQITNI